MMYKSKTRQIFRLFLTGVVFLVLLCTFNPQKAKANELFSDEDGNLYFHTRDKKALGDVRFLTVAEQASLSIKMQVLRHLPDVQVLLPWFCLQLSLISTAITEVRQ